MEDMAKHPRLHTLGRIYYAPVAVPTDIKMTFGRAEIWKSLKTSDYQAALYKLRTEIDPQFELLFNTHRQEQARLAAPPLEKLTDDQVRLIGDAYYRHLLEEDEESRESGFETDNEDGPAVGFLDTELMCSRMKPEHRHAKTEVQQRTQT